MSELLPNRADAMRSLRGLSGLLIVTLCLARPATVEGNCITQFDCANSSGIPIFRLVFPVGNMWGVTPPEPGTHLHSSLALDTDYAAMLRTAMSNWTSGTAMPQDNAQMLPGSTNAFSVYWLPRTTIAGNPDADRHDEGEPLAEGPPFEGDDNTSMECAITRGWIGISYNPQYDDNNRIYWADCPGENCLPPLNPSCGHECVVDLPSVLAHEYGHVLGFDHNDTPDATMNTPIKPNDVEFRHPLSCEKEQAGACYAEKYGPARLDSFVVATGAMPPVLRWSCGDERKWSAYRLVKREPGGVSWVIADAVECTRTGAVYEVVDEVSDPTVDGVYALAVRDSVGSGVERLILLGEAEWSGGQSGLAPMLAHTPSADPIEWAGFGSIPELVENIDDALVRKGSGLERRVFADGFEYVSASGRWGRVLDKMLVQSSQVCWDSAGARRDSLDVGLVESTQLMDGVEQAQLSVRYMRAHLSQVAESAAGGPVGNCVLESIEWTGRLVAIVERLSLESGWKVRRIEEVFASD